MNRKNGTSARDTASCDDSPAIVTYRELAPHPALRDYVRAYFSFVPAAPWSGRAVTREVQFTREQSFCSPVFADGHTSLVVDLGAACQPGEGWTCGTPVSARAIGALRQVGEPAGASRSAMLGVFLEPGATSGLLHVPASELTDRVVSLEDIWGSDGARLAEDLAEMDEVSRVNRLEAVLLRRVRRSRETRSSVASQALARWARSAPATVNVARLADATGVSRQHLTRVFREAIGVSPKRYCRLARFQAGLAYTGARDSVKWAQAAATLGYADQSHMIAEFRELSSLTPEALASKPWFHPFILEARSRLCERRLVIGNRQR